MPKLYLATLGAVALSLAGCAPSDPAGNAVVDTLAARTINCAVGPDCDAKWSRASTWIAQNSAYKVQTASEALIQTMGPLPDDPRSAYTVTKVAGPDNAYQISITGGCDNIFGCQPSIKQAKADFYSFVTAADATKTENVMHKGQPIGIQAVPVSPDVASQLRLEPARGLVVVFVAPNGLAAKAGIARNDVILSANGSQTDVDDELAAALEAASKSHRLVLQVWRAGAATDVTVPYKI
jgi:hypothetical protein